MPALRRRLFSLPVHRCKSWQLVRTAPREAAGLDQRGGAYGPRSHKEQPQRVGARAARLGVTSNAAPRSARRPDDRKPIAVPDAISLAARCRFPFASL